MSLLPAGQGAWTFSLGSKKQKETSPGRLELPTSRLTVGRANQLRHGDVLVAKTEILCIFLATSSK
ncbi:uncharacterized protein N7515_005072 [Penicillium bovifimosum]|uniref:Uncharacterized protein n=1 Tax=Penicillium bovifimosum TaxID=126998 RepID=A0A9W9L4J6_9EURO|nr:uncharacterized protein N7515_005072 [Penicillium bovifimosum]KAJ5135794.1 hypothetical protein N7515_005072 [Penicillium bovifimosum]